MKELRIKELAEKFASELKNRLDWNELVELGNELDLSIDELEYFGWLDNDEEEPFSCEQCPYYYADCYDEDDMFEEGCCYCHYVGPDNQAPCSYEEYEEEYDYSENMSCDTYGMCAGSSCPGYFECQCGVK